MRPRRVRPRATTGALGHAVARQIESEVELELDQPSGLGSMAQRAGYSPFHFHRLFSDAVGETPKDYVERLRLERSAYLLAITDDRVLQVALSVGFSNHETFSRAFRRKIGISPLAYRALAKKAQAERLAKNEGFSGDGCHLSDVWFGSLSSARLLAIRHVGPYSEVAPPFSDEDRLWTSLAERALAAGIAYDTSAWMMCLDDPTVTPAARQRLDACLVLQSPAAFTPERPFKAVAFAGGLHAGTEHRGPHETLIQAYRHVADGIRRSEKFVFGLGPPLEILRHIDRDPNRNRTEIYFPVARR